MKQTETIRIAYNWAERNKVQVLHYGSRQWETGNDEDEALAEACRGLQTPALSMPAVSAEVGKIVSPALLPNYPHQDVLSPGPNKLRAHNPLEIVALCFALEIIAGLIWMVMR